MNNACNLTKWIRATLLALLVCCSIQCFAQQPPGWILEKIPVDLETDFALSALPPHLRKDATVYLLDPKNGFYIARSGTNGFMCFVARTEWEWGFFSKDIATPISYDAVGAEAIFSVYQDVESMRASGNYTALQIKDTVMGRIKRGIYKAPSAGISYMLAPLMRNYSGHPGDNMVMTMSVPHYMFYAPYVTNSDIGTIPGAGHGGPIIINQGSLVLGERKGPHGYIILPAGNAEKAQILNDSKELMQRLADYRPYFKVENMNMTH